MDYVGYALAEGDMLVEKGAKGGADHPIIVEVGVGPDFREEAGEAGDEGAWVKSSMAPL
jgi:hypothetical protein